ncbi:hypothetical protein CALCODRAFT_46787 [Calocera cornea HHB12733]|uniref:Uncharacterized protein n=1 Tax=Calocera cornea HHB12733 TaxID=1353952 RepID=A0A165J068_9BASI|nr:hypothetical protein CALCODRAFT_46787 [Calocera cornea HHB12733]
MSGSAGASPPCFRAPCSPPGAPASTHRTANARHRPIDTRIRAVLSSLGHSRAQRSSSMPIKPIFMMLPWRSLTISAFPPASTLHTTDHHRASQRSPSLQPGHGFHPGRSWCTPEEAASPRPAHLGFASAGHMVRGCLRAQTPARLRPDFLYLLPCRDDALSTVSLSSLLPLFP